MSTITRFTKEQLIERAKKKIATMRFCIAQSAYESVRESLEIELHLAEIALASLTAQPVAWTDEQELRDVDESGIGYLFAVNPITPHSDPRRVIKLYTVPPVPVFPDEMTISDDMNLYQKSFAQGHNAFRAAMLNKENENG